MYKIIDSKGRYHKKGLKLETTLNIDKAGTWETLDNAKNHIKQSLLVALVKYENLSTETLETLANSYLVDCITGCTLPLKPMFVQFLKNVRERMMDGHYHKDLSRFNNMIVAFLKL